MVAEQVDRHDAVRRQAGAAGGIEIGAVEHGTARRGVIQVHLQGVQGAVIGVVVDIVERIHLTHVQALVVGRQLV